MHFVTHQLWGIEQVIYSRCWQGCMQTTGAHSPPGPRRTVVSRPLETFKRSAPEIQMTELSIGGASSNAVKERNWKWDGICGASWKEKWGNKSFVGFSLLSAIADNSPFKYHPI